MILNRYILKQLVIGFSVVLFSMTTLVWLTQSLRMIDMIVTKGVGLRVFLTMTILVLPNFLQILSPLALFAVALFVFVRMQSDKEVMVMQAIGMSPAQIMKPVLMMAAVLTVVGYLMSLELIPTANTHLREMRWKVKNDLSHLLFQEGQFNSFKGGMTLYIRERTPEGGLKGVLAYDASNPERLSLLAAENGTVYRGADGLSIDFYQGTRQEVSPQTKEIRILKFDKYTLGIQDEPDSKRGRVADVRELPMMHLLGATKSPTINASTYRKMKVEAVKRLTQPLYNVVFALLAMFGVLSGYYSRRGKVGRLNLVVGLAVLLQSCALAFENMAAKNLSFLPLMVVNIFIPALLLYVALVPPKGKRWRAILKKIGIGVVLMTAWGAWAATPTVDVDMLKKDQPVDFEADRIDVNQKTGDVTASGNVVLTQNGAQLTTEKILYHQKTQAIDIPTPINATLPDGTQMTAQHATMHNGFDDMVTGALEMRLYEGTRLKAEKLKRNEYGNTVYLNEAIYTPCATCGTEKPLWQLRAHRMKHDKAAQEFSYRHVFLDVKEVPVFYFPYLQMPDFTVKRKTGFLAPSLTSSSEMKGGFSLPFFIDIAPNQNLTITPAISFSHLPLVLADYQGKFKKGIFNLQTSATQDNDTHNQAHIKAKFAYDISPQWRASGQLFRTATDTYFRRYDIPGIDDSQSFLTSYLKAERFGVRSYFKGTGYSFQSLQEGVRSHSLPTILPVFDYQYNTKPLTSFGLYAYSALNSALINTRDDFRSNRLSFTQGIRAPYISPFGVAFDIDASVRMDGYAIDTGDYSFGGRPTHDRYATSRLYPNLSIQASYPFARVGQHTTQVIEPIAMLVVTPNMKEDEDIPNVDSLVFDFDDTNLFSRNRFAGYDRVETGTRVNYGLKWALYDNNTHRAFSALFGQSYKMREKQENDIDALMGYSPHFSDYVGRLQMDYKYLTVAYRFRLGQDDFRVKKNEIYVFGGADPLRLGIDYVYLKSYQMQDEVYPSREEIVFFGTSKLTKNISFIGSYRLDLAKGGGPIDAVGSVRYDTDCAAFVFEVSKSFTKDRDYQGDTSMMFKVILKTLGGV